MPTFYFFVFTFETAEIVEINALGKVIEKCGRFLCTLEHEIEMR